MDFFKVALQSGSATVAHMIDVASKYQAARVVHGETTTDAIHALEREWVRNFGNPKRLQVDEGRGFCSKDFVDWTDQHGIQLLAAPGEAHERMGAIERSHAVLREALETYLETEQITRTVENVKDALNYVPSQVNRLTHHKGFSPAQWVLGYDPALTGSISADIFNIPAQETILLDDEFAKTLNKRTAAAEAFLRADASDRLRRALLRKFRSTQESVEVGQQCYYWREQGTRKLDKTKWHGPATVCMREDNEQGRPRLYWVTHGTSLIRCSGEQIRPLVEEIGQNVEKTWTPHG